MKLRYSSGIDLGSTTTKAVILGEQGEVLGRGITNSRSNYDVACQVALSEALVRARFSLIEAALPAGDRARMVEFELAFRCQQYLAQLLELGTRTHEAAHKLRAGAPVVQALERILAQMASEASSMFVPGVGRKSDFFRDLAGARYVALAEAMSRAEKLPFDMIVALYDKAILEVENSTAAVGDFAAMATRALGTMRGCPPTMQQAVTAKAGIDMEQIAVVGTGYGRQRLPFPEKRIRSEILCHGLGAHHMYPSTRTVLDIGGQDTKAIQIDDQGIVTSFQMNDRCAAGCGRYLGYIADEMNLGLHELGPLAEKAQKQVRINSTCTVFAGAELRERLSLGEKREDILGGLHRAIVLRAMSLLARSGGIQEQFTFTGGVARNTEAVKALRKLVMENYGERTLNISPDSIYTGALGAALFAFREVQQGLLQEGVA